MIEHVTVRETKGKGTLDVSRTDEGEPPPEDRLSARVLVSAKDPAFAGALAAEIAAAMRDAAPIAPRVDVVRVRTRKRAASLTAEGVADKAVIVVVTARNTRWLSPIVDTVRSANPLGVQLVWDGSHGRDRVFDVLERARATPHLSPVFLAKTDDPCFVLRAQVGKRKDGARC